MDASLANKLPEMKRLLLSHGVETCHLFGSAAKGGMHKNSDYDLLVRFSEQVPLLHYADNYFELLEKLRLLLGRDIDLVTERSLRNPVLIKEIRNTRELILHALR
jgi:predicted nucleotidyltransferase